MRRPTRAVLALTGAVLGAGLLVGCGAGTGTAYKTSVSADSLSPAAAVRAATTATEQTGSASVRLTLTMDSGGTTETVDVRGVAALDGSAADLTATLPGESGPTTVQQRVVDGVVYLRVEGSDVLPATWIKLDPAALGGGEDLGDMLGGAGTGTVTAPLDALREVADVQEVGSEEIDGIPTTHYRATLDPAKVAAALAPLESVGGRKARAGTMPVDLWVDADGHVVRVTQTIDLGAADAGSVTWTLDLREFGEPLDVTAPSGALDIGSILGGLGSLLSGEGGDLGDLGSLLEGGDLGSLLEGGDLGSLLEGEGGADLEELSGLLDGLLGGSTTS
jgi:hypothetical protein